MIVKKYGYIARVFGTAPPDIINGHFEIPEKAWEIPELGQYQEVYFIDSKLAKKFIEALCGGKIRGDKHELNDAVKNIIFSQGDWNKVIISFDGKYPEIILCDLMEINGVAYINPFDGIERLTPENISVKIRVMLDENGRQVKETDLARVSWGEVFADKNKRNTETFEDMLRRQGFEPFDIFKTADQRIKEKDRITPEAIDAHKMDDKTLDEFYRKRNALLSRYVQDYEKKFADYYDKIFAMTFEQIEKEYRMEFGE